jgi:CRP/FNR family transcriptional regulator
MLTVTDHSGTVTLPALARSAIIARGTARNGIPPHLIGLRSPRSIPTPRCQNCPVQGLSLCNSLQFDELAELNAMVADVQYGDMNTLFDEDAPATFVHIITDGIVRLHRTLADGRRLILGFGMPGDFLGLSIHDRNAYSADAIGPVSTCKISLESFSELLDAKPHLMRRLHTETAHELTIAQDQMVILGRCNASEKLARFLLNMRNRWKRVNGQSAHIALPMTRQDIGDFLGLTIETVSRKFNSFAREKLIVIVPDGVRLLDPVRLASIGAP